VINAGIVGYPQNTTKQIPECVLSVSRFTGITTDGKKKEKNMTQIDGTISGRKQISGMA
jgi:hypothetical protein